MTGKPSEKLIEQIALVQDEPMITGTGQIDAVAQLVDEVLELKEVIDGYKEVLKAAEERYDTLRKTRIPEAMRHAGLVDAAGHGKLSHHSGARVHLRQDLNAYVLAADRSQLFTWLRAEGHGAMIQETVNHQTLKAFCKEQKENNGLLPDFIKTSPETVAVITVQKKEE